MIDVMDFVYNMPTVIYTRYHQTRELMETLSGSICKVFTAYANTIQRSYVWVLKHTRTKIHDVKGTGTVGGKGDGGNQKWLPCELKAWNSAPTGTNRPNIRAWHIVSIRKTEMCAFTTNLWQKATSMVQFISHLWFSLDLTSGQKNWIACYLWWLLEHFSHNFV